MITCKQASQLISRNLEKTLTMRERFALKFHLILCKYCSRFSQQLKTLNVAISNMGKQVEDDANIQLPAKTKTRIVKALESDAE